MAVLSKTSDGKLTFYCPACYCHHYIDDRWSWNGNENKPTIKPSIKVTHPDGGICHFFITNGRIDYLADCSHDLSNRSIEMADDNDYDGPEPDPATESAYYADRHNTGA